MNHVLSRLFGLLLVTLTSAALSLIAALAGFQILWSSPRWTTEQWVFVIVLPLLALAATAAAGLTAWWAHRRGGSTWPAHGPPLREAPAPAVAGRHRADRR